ncbi:HNH endonuclease signature motif containing protein [Escherichia coli]
MPIKYTSGGSRYEISRASYTRQVWKRNHMAWGRPTPGCWNTVHCGKRDSSYTLYHRMATNKGREITGLSAPEFQFLFEALDAKSAWMYIEGDELRFYLSGKWHTFTRGKSGNIRDVLKKLELLGNADAERVKTQKATQKAAATAKAAKRASAVALTQELGLMAENAPAAPLPIPPVTYPYTVYVVYLRLGVPEERLKEFHEWYRLRTGHFSGVKLRKVIQTWLAIHTVGPVPEIVAAPVYELPALQLCLPAPSAESLAADKARAKAARKYTERKKRERKPRQRALADERAHEDDVPFYGRRRRNQALFHADVAQNCGYRCVYTLASELRCDAAHLVPHARKGGASFKNGILLRKDLHVLMDANHCAIDPADLTLWFSAEILASDPDLAALNGKAMRPTDKPIKRDNLMARWDAFLEIYMA